MKFAHFAQIFPRRGETAAERYEQLWRELELCDELGFDFGFASIHHLSHMRPQATVYCTAAAARTRRIRLGPMGYTGALYDPLRIVEEVAVLDNAIHGRLEVGLVTGVTRDEFRVYHADWDNRGAIANEALELFVKAFTSEKPFDFEGRFHRYEEVRLSVDPLQKPHPPTWLISLQSDARRLAAATGSHTGYSFFRSRLEAAPEVGDYLRMWRDHGHRHEPNVVYPAFIYVGETDAEAVATASPLLRTSMEEIYGGELGGGGIARAETIQRQGQVQSAEIRRNMFDIDFLRERDVIFVGAPDTVAAKLQAAAAEGLFNVFAGEFNIGAIREEDLMRSIRLFATHVIPELRKFDPTLPYLSPTVGAAR